MKLVLILSALVVISHQQFQHRTRPRELVWLSHYPHRDALDNYHPTRFYNDYLPYRPSSRIGDIHYQNEDFNQDFTPNIVEDEPIVEVPVDAHSRSKGVLRWPSVVYKKQNGGRFFYSTTINNPFLKTATFTLSSTLTTVASIVLCVPANNLAAVPAPTCAGRRRRQTEDTDIAQFPISPSETLKLIPTTLPSLGSTLTNNRESRPLPINELQIDHQRVYSSKDEGHPAEMLEDNQKNPREKRFFGGGIAASTTVTSYSFVAATLTSTVLLDPTAGGLAACLPAGYVVCA
ncbi:hypothetical protein DAPPUDRAFT_229109 [Daphnia pulex]|uniref:Uncharacterized protein n=1 Tax=Daphnia pulex TaxID=6669 RepID=E9HK75_DAPPU|nr:hypothetical protein DAPPUDRAFT_229109 [Daphnia pulex]|eukprot:EFX67881.1 hypothetical protein DAPPUDRAFT_229109 [Daphnia pulex]